MKRFSPAWIRKLAIAGILASGSLAAFPWSSWDGELTGSLDTTVSWGMGFRMTNPDSRRVGGDLNNFDDGNLNYRVKDLYSHFVKGIVEFEANYKRWSVFARADGLYDWQVMGKNTRRTPLDKAARGTLGHDARLLDLFMQHDTNIGDIEMSVRVGDQVVNWGESTFVQNGLNVINPLDVSRLRGAGAELREALLPLPMLRVDLIFSENWSFMGFWNWWWRETRLDPLGTFFSTSDAIGPGCNYFMINPDASDINPAPATFIGRGEDDDGSDLVNAGVTLQYFAEWLNNTEMALYFGWHSMRLPVVCGYRGEPAAIPGGGGAVTNLGIIPDDLGTVRYIVCYPDHVKFAGISFNTMIQDVAVQGEYSYHFDVPWQRDVAGLLGRIIIPPGPPDPGPFGFVKGWKRGSYSQAQATATHLFSQTFGADVVTLLYEVGACYVHCFDKDAIGSGYDRFSMGYRILANATYNNAFGAVTLTPQVAINHDLFGSTPLPLLTFTKDRISCTMSVIAQYQALKGSIGYTFNTGRVNSAIDRDFLVLSTQYSY